MNRWVELLAEWGIVQPGDESGTASVGHGVEAGEEQRARGSGGGMDRGSGGSMDRGRGGSMDRGRGRGRSGSARRGAGTTT